MKLKLKLGHILTLLMLLNWSLLIFYFTYYTQDQEFSLNETKLMFNQMFDHHQDEVIQEVKEIDEGEEFYFEEFIYEQVEQENVFIDDAKGTLYTIGDENVDTNYDYIVSVLDKMNPIKPAPLSLQPIRKQIQLNLLKDDNYCKLNNLYILTHQQFPINIVTDYPSESLITHSLNLAGTDLLPNIPIDTNRQFHIPFDATVFFMENLNFHKYYQIGTQFLCNFQAYNHIPGIEILLQKSTLFQFLQKTQLPQPSTYVMNNKTQCQEFFKNIDSLNESDYIIKNHVRRTVSQQNLEITLVRRKYQNGKFCGKVIDDFIVQKKVDSRSKRFFAILFISLIEPLQYQVFDGFYYKVVKGVTTNHTKYNETISQIIKDQVEQFIHKIELVNDNRFFSLLRMEFIEADQIYLLSINSHLDKDGQIQDYMTSLVVTALQMVNFQQRQRLSLYQIEHH